jgi:hypothetical protein
MFSIRSHSLPLLRMFSGFATPAFATPKILKGNR